MTVAELIAQLRELPQDAPVLTSGYEGGLTVAHLGGAEVQLLDGMPDWMGAYLSPAEALRELQGAGESGWQMMVDGVAPTRVGDPVTAVVIYRAGR